MGKPRFLLAGVTALLCACGEPESLLVAGDASQVYGEGGAYGPSSLVPAEYGSIDGVVTFKGRAAKQRTLKLSDDFCINANPNGIASEDFEFDPDSGALGGVFVYISKGVNKRLEDQHDVPSEALVLDQIGCQYVPHLAVLRVGQPLVVKSSDNTLHNVAMQLQKNGPPTNEVMNAPGTMDAKYFRFAEREPVLVKCDVHGWMKAYIAIVSHPYCKVTDSEGRFSLPGVPPGTYKLTFWHEVLGKQEMDVEVKPNEKAEADLLWERT